MKKGIVDKYTRSKLLRKKVTKGVIITALLIFIIIALAYYGQNVGNYVIRMNNVGTRRGIALCESQDFRQTTSRLTATPVDNAQNSAYSYIPNDIEEGLGSKNCYRGQGEDGEYQCYFAYSFYLVNAGQETADVRYMLNIDKAVKGVDSIMYVMLITNGTKEVFAKAQEEGEDIGKPEILYGGKRNEDRYVIGETTPFVSDDIVLDRTVKDLEVNQSVKFTVVMWLDGWDAQCNDTRLGGALRLSMDFSIVTDQ